MATDRIAERRTSDNRVIEIWSNGAVTGRMGFGLDGVPLARPKTAEAIARELTVAWLFAGEVELYDYAEIGALHRACRKVAAKHGTPGDVRAETARLLTPAAPALRWAVRSADRDGRPTERVAVLPRLFWPGLVVFDFCGSAGSKRGRYQVWRTEGAHGACFPTGCDFSTLAELWTHLRSVSEVSRVY